MNIESPLEIVITKCCSAEHDAKRVTLPKEVTQSDNLYGYQTLNYNVKGPRLLSSIQHYLKDDNFRTIKAGCTIVCVETSENRKF